MPPKIGKQVQKKVQKKKEPPPPEPEPVPQLRLESVGDIKLDLLLDLNDEFFGAANKTIQSLKEADRHYEAVQIKKYVDILFKVHRKYVDEVKQNLELAPQVIRADTKLRLALELTANNDEGVANFKKALIEAWKESDASLLREQDIQEKLQAVLIKCDNQENKEVKNRDDSAEFGNLAKYKNIILRERDRLNGEVNDVTKRLALQRFYSEGLENINKICEDNTAKMTKQMKLLEIEKENLELKIRNLMTNLEDQKERNTKTVTKLETITRELSETTEKLHTKVTAYDQLKHSMDKLKNENSLNVRQLTKYEEEIADLHKTQKENEGIIKGLRLEDKVKANNILQLTNKHKKISKDYDTISSKLLKQNRVNHSLTEDIARYKNTNNALEKDLLSSGQKWESMHRLKENVQRERDTLRTDITKLNNSTVDLKHTLMIQSNNISNLRMDINKLNLKMDEAKITISKAERERDNMAQEVETLNERIESYQNEVQLKGDQLIALNVQLKDERLNVFGVKKVLEETHAEKLFFKKELDCCTQERDDFRDLQNINNHQILQLTREISSNQNHINSLNLKIERLNNDKKELQTKLKSKDSLLSSVRKELKGMKSKNESLIKTIADDEHKFMKLSQELEETRKEKNLIGLQMVRRNDEIVLLKDKFGIMETALDRGKSQYNQLVEDIRLLKIEITNLTTERDCLTRSMNSTADMREEIVRLHRLLNQERIKSRALMDDAKTPTSVHRWRILKGEDPQRFKLIEKVQMLQRRNLKQGIEKQNLQQLVAEKQKLCNNLQKIIDEMPKTDVKIKLVETQRLYRQQEIKMKALCAEVAIDRIEIKSRDCEIEQLKKEQKSNTEPNATQQRKTNVGRRAAR